MTLRKQTKIVRRQKNVWTIEEVGAGLQNFFEQNGRYPTATEIDAYEYLPSSRTLERNFGGVVGVRKFLGLGEEHDFRKGSHSSKRAYTINKRAHATENQVYTYLVNRFKREFVHREYFFTDDARTRTDFLIYDKSGGFCVDVFYPSTIRNLGTCINIKSQKYRSLGEFVKSYPIIFLQMNEDIAQETIDQLIKRKEKVMLSNQFVMDWSNFEKFCLTRKALNVGTA